MKIAYVMTGFDASDIKYTFGIGYFITQHLKEHGVKIDYIGGYKEPFKLFFQAKQAYYRYLRNQKYWRHREPYILKNHAIKASKEIERSGVDAVFAFGSIPIAYLETDKPMIFWTDATFGGLLNYYDEYSRLSRETIINANELERMALGKCTNAIFSSEWAKDTAINLYGADTAKLRIVGFGANILTEPKKVEVEQMIDRRLDDINSCIRLIFIGREWRRKGGDIAYEVTQELNKLGRKAELHVVGCQPELNEPQPKYVITYGLVPKSSTDWRDKIERLISRSHFLIIPSRADNTPHVYCEANAFGLPVIALRTGGVPSVVSDGINGFLFEPGTGIDRICEKIINIVSDRKLYGELCRSSYNEYTNRLNWRTSTGKVKQIIEEAL